MEISNTVKESRGNTKFAAWESKGIPMRSRGK